MVNKHMKRCLASTVSEKNTKENHNGKYQKTIIIIYIIIYQNDYKL